MASGWGIRGDVNECFKHFNSFATCMKENPNSAAPCIPLRDDYFECLHHRKEYARIKEILAERDRQIAGLSLDKNEGSSNGHGGGAGGHH